jgi:hypothetical protein
MLAACGGDSTGPDLESLSVAPAVGLVVGVGGTSRFLATATVASGGSILASDATWISDDPSIVTVDDRGLATGVSAGLASITASVGAFSASAQVEVYVPVPVADYLPGVSYFGRRDYVEYIPGELPVVLSVPHGGALTPTEISDCTFGTVVTDRNTLELTLAVREALIDLTGYAPHVIISHLRRTKLDPNREVEEAAQDDPFAENAWEEFHGFVERARTPLIAIGGGMYFDMHGHGHPRERLELGYLLSTDRLNQSDANLNSLAIIQMTSIREIGRASPIPFSQLLRGPTSLGGLLEAEGVAAVPSPSEPSPGSDEYFTGGYNTRRHGSIDDGEVVSGIQIEHHFPGLRDTDVNRRAYATRLAVAIRSYVLEHFGYFEP